jgi:hypothetical protein
LVALALALEQETPLRTPSEMRIAVANSLPTITSIQRFNQSREGQLVLETRNKIRQIVPVELNNVRDQALYLLKKIARMGGSNDNLRVLHGPLNTTPIIAAHLLVNSVQPTPVSTEKVLAKIAVEFEEKGLGPISRKTCRKLSRAIKMLNPTSPAAKKNMVRMERENNLHSIFTSIALQFGNDFYISRPVEEWIRVFEMEDTYPSSGAALTAFHRECAYQLLGGGTSRQSIIKLTEAVGPAGNFDHWSIRVKRLLALEEPK